MMVVTNANGTKYCYTQEQMDMVKLGLENIKDFVQSPEDSWKVEGEVKTIEKILSIKNIYTGE